MTAQEIEFIVSGIADESIPDYQLSAFLMAVFIQGMTPEETAHYTQAMMNSGDVLDLTEIAPNTVDKHSTGGVGDKISLVLAPAVAAAGGIVPMMSGRGLGHTGGTLDKLESIPGYRVGLSEEEFRQALKTLGVAIIGQTGRLAPADKKLYSLRDVTATVDSIPLITGSIMSKKLASGPASIVMDVKWGSGAFMKTIEDARALAQSMAAVGQHMGRQVTSFITDMNQPLGRMVGNALEIKEVIDTLKGAGPADIVELTRNQAGEMLKLAGLVSSFEEGCQKFDEVIANGSAYEKFLAMVENQGGDSSYLKDYSKLPQAKEVSELKAETGGFVQEMDSVSIGIASVMLGGGRERSEDIIDHAVGFEVLKKVGDPVEAGEPLAIMHASPQSKTQEAGSRYLNAVKIGSAAPQARALIVERI